MKYVFTKPTITLASSLIMNSAWQPLPRESPLKLMFKELYIKSSNSWERFKLQSRNICCFPCIFQWGDQREREKKVDKTTVVLLYYWNRTAACDRHFMQEERKNLWGGHCTYWQTGPEFGDVRNTFLPLVFLSAEPKIKFANLTEAISGWNNEAIPLLSLAVHKQLWSWKYSAINPHLYKCC